MECAAGDMARSVHCGSLMRNSFQRRITGWLVLRAVMLTLGLMVSTASAEDKAGKSVSAQRWSEDFREPGEPAPQFDERAGPPGASGKSSSQENVPAADASPGLEKMPEEGAGPTGIDALEPADVPVTRPASVVGGPVRQSEPQEYDFGGGPVRNSQSQTYDFGIEESAEWASEYGADSERHRGNGVACTKHGQCESRHCQISWGEPGLCVRREVESYGVWLIPCYVGPLLAYAVDDPSPLVIGLAGAPIVHWVNGQVGKGFLSLGGQLGAAMTGALIFGTQAHREAHVDGDRLILGALVGHALWAAVDVLVLAKKVKHQPRPRVAKITVMPSVSASETSGTLGVQGTW